MDISDTLAPRSDQLNAEDMLAGPVTVTVESVDRGSAEQPVNIHLVEFPGRPFKPCKTMRRILAMAWGSDASKYTGRRMTLFRDPDVRFGGQSVGGIRISHLSHIEKRITVALTQTRGKRASHLVDPLPDAPTPPPPISDDDAIDFERDIAEASTLQALNKVGADLKAANLGGHADKLRAAWSARKAEIEGGEK